MKKYLIIFIALAILAPVAAQAFSFADVVNFGRWLIHREIKSEAVEAEKEKIATPRGFQSLSAEKKYQNWRNAFDKKDVALAIADDRNLYFTDAEINFLITEELAAMDNPPVSDIKIAFVDGLIVISGNSALKNFNGQFNVEAKPAKINGQLGLRVTRARYRNFYFPSFLAQNILAGQIRGMINFLHSNADYQNLAVTVGSSFIELDYGQ